MQETLKTSTLALPETAVSTPASTFLRQVGAIAAKDVRLELRSREMLTTSIVYALMLVLVFNFAFDLAHAEMARLAPAMLWVAITLSAVLGLNHVFAKEKDNSAIEGLLLSPVDRTAIYLGKYLGALALTIALEVVFLPIFAAVTDQPVISPVPLLALLLGTAGFLSVGTLFAAVSTNTRTREILLPVLLFPIATPLLVAGVEATSIGLKGQPFGEAAGWLGLLLAYDVVFLLVCPPLFRYVVSELTS